MIIDSFSNPSVELHFERIHSDASHDHDDDQEYHNPRVRISLHPHSTHMEFSSSDVGGSVFTPIVGPTVELNLSAFIATANDPDRQIDRRAHLHAALTPLIAALDVDTDTKREILYEIIEQTENSIEAIGGLFEETFELKVTAIVLVGTHHRVIEGFKGVAAEAEIVALESVKVDEVSETQCLICLVDFMRENESENESNELCRLGCLHAFHGDCLRAWLKISHYCPLCRFQLPTDH